MNTVSYVHTHKALMALFKVYFCEPELHIYSSMNVIPTALRQKPLLTILCLRLFSGVWLQVPHFYLSWLSFSYPGQNHPHKKVARIGMLQAAEHHCPWAACLFLDMRTLYVCPWRLKSLGFLGIHWFFFWLLAVAEAVQYLDFIRSEVLYPS